MKPENNILWSVESGIGYLLLNNPPGNEMTPAFFNELKELVKNIIPRSKVKAIIISGSGRHFSSGADIDSLLDMVSVKNKTSTDTLASNLQSFRFFENLKIPVISAIRGVCIGSALELAMFSHFRLCGEGAVLGLPESTFGLIPGVGGIQKMNHLARKAKTIELILKGNTFTAEEALQWNIVDLVVEKKHLMEYAKRLAELSADNYRKYNKSDYIRKLGKYNIDNDE
ncbi:MAG: hypothetical protein B6D61_12585 [Bacteroidetes bacterium 4484_249]|nr:MAG: hypothetical protein B6D61_12585 [Bacteroidetes bacterium 4484_249]